MKSSTNAILIVLLAISLSIAESNKGFGNDIIVNIGQGNGDNMGSGIGVKKGPSDTKSTATKATQTLCTPNLQNIEVEADLVESHLKQGGTLGSCPVAEEPTPSPTTMKMPENPAPNTPSEPQAPRNDTKMPIETPAPRNETKAPIETPTPRNETKAPIETPTPRNETNAPLPSPRNETKSPRKTRTPQNKTKAPKKKAIITAIPTTSPPNPVRVPVCLPQVLTSIMVPVESLGAFLAKGASLGACPVATPAPVMTNAPGIVQMPAPPMPSIIQQRQTVEIVQDGDCASASPYQPGSKLPHRVLTPPLLKPASVPRISKQ